MAHAPKCRIRIWKDSTHYFDATYYQVSGGKAVISKAENRPGSATFTLLNRYDDESESLCASTFSQWVNSSTGNIDLSAAGEIRPGMFVEMSDMSGTAEFPIFDGRITTMTPQGTTVAFEVGDGITFLSKTGTWLRRNYRQAGQTGQTYRGGTVSAGTLTVDLSDVGGTPTALYRLRTVSASPAMSRSGSGTEVTYNAEQSCIISSYTCSKLRRLTFTIGYVIRGMYLLYSMSPTVTISSDAGAETVYPTPVMQIPYNTRGTASFTVDLGENDASGTVKISILPNLAGYRGKNGVITTEYRDTSAGTLTIQMDREETVTVKATTYTDSADTEDEADPGNRLRVVYTNGSVQTSDIIQWICQALGYGIEVGTDVPSKKLAVFRAGGAFAQSYIQKLADQVDDDGYAISYVLEGFSPVMKIGRRYKVSDSPSLIAMYAGDEIPSGYTAKVVNIAEFSPKKTLKNRSNLVTLKASLEDKTQVLVSFEDSASTDYRGGITVESLVADSNASTIQGIGSAAYAKLVSTDLDEWEGELVLAGIENGMMSEGDSAHAGSGVPVLIQDSRYGMSSFRTRVRQVEYDYNTCKTALTLGNYDSQYSSGIASTNALAVEVSDLVGGISDTTLYNQQHIYLKTDPSTWGPGTSPSVRILTVTGTEVGLDNAAIYELPNGDHVAIGTAEATSATCVPASYDYGVTSVKLVGSSTLTVAIPSERRPDFILGQSLSVCVLIRST